MYITYTYTAVHPCYAYICAYERMIQLSAVQNDLPDDVSRRVISDVTRLL